MKKRLLLLLLSVFLLYMIMGDKKVLADEVSEKFNVYVTAAVNVRDVSGNIVGRKYKGELIRDAEQVDGYYQFTEAGEVKRIHASFISEEAIPGTAYAAEAVNIRDAKTGEVIGALRAGNSVSGIQSPDGWLYFDRNGVEAKAYISLLQYIPVKIPYYAQKIVNVRNALNGEIIGCLNPFDQVTGTTMGDWVYFTYQGQAAKAYAPFLSNDPYVEAYILKGTNIRQSPNGTIIGSTKNPKYIKGLIEQNWIRFVEDNQVKYVYKGCTSVNSPSYKGYLSCRANIRKRPNGTLLGSEKTGYYIQGILEQDWVRFDYEGQTAYIYEPLLNPARTLTNRYIFQGTNIRDAANGNRIDRTNRVHYVRGYLQGDWFEFIEDGLKKYAYTDFTGAAAPEQGSSIIIPPGFNIRSSATDKVIRVTDTFEYFYGRVAGNKIYFKDKNIDAYAYLSIGQKDTKKVIAKSINSEEEYIDVYSKPDIKSKTVGYLNSKETIEGILLGDWVRITYQNKTGYINKKFLKIESESYTDNFRMKNPNKKFVLYISPANQPYNMYFDNKTSETDEMYALMALVQKELAPYNIKVVIPDHNQEVKNGHFYVRGMPERMEHIKYYGRPEEARAGNADFYLALHSNATGIPIKRTGPLAIYNGNYQVSRDFAQKLSDELKAIITYPNVYGNYPESCLDGSLAFDGAGYAEIREPGRKNIPSVILEVDYHDNPVSGQYIRNNRAGIAKAIRKATVNQFQLTAE